MRFQTGNRKDSITNRAGVYSNYILTKILTAFDLWLESLNGPELSKKQQANLIGGGGGVISR